MASSAKQLISLLFISSVLFIQIQARESNFFSKIPNTAENFESVSKETEIPNKAIDPALTNEKTTTPQEQEPNFIPQTQNNGYGLYGHESGQLPPSATTKNGGSGTGSGSGSGRPFNNYYQNYQSNNPYKTQSEEFYSYNNNNNFQESGNPNSNSRLYANSVYYNKDLYESGRQNNNYFNNAKLSRDDYTTTPLYNQENNNNFHHYNNGGYSNNQERKGMSDTRFLENGKYYYDVDREPEQDRYRNTNTRSWNNNNRGPYGNNNEYSTNSMEGYQNDDAEFQEESNEFMP